MDEAIAGAEDVELVGGPLDGQLIRYGPGEAPRRSLAFGRGLPTWVYERTGDRTRDGATVFRLAGPEATEGPG